MKRPVPWHPTAGLWWTAFLVVVAGGGIAYFLSLDRVNPDARMGMAVAIMLTIVTAGICVIGATAHWWMRR